MTDHLFNTMKSKPKTKRGGKRQGAGRHSVGGIKRDVKINIQTTAGCAKRIRSLGKEKGGLGAALESLLPEES